MYVANTVLSYSGKFQKVKFSNNVAENEIFSKRHDSIYIRTYNSYLKFFSKMLDHFQKLNHLKFSTIVTV